MHNDDKLVALFKTISEKDEAESKKAGRPIFRDVEAVEIRSPGDRLRVGVYPAHSFSHWEVDRESGEQRQVTYAERFSAQYRAFKERRHQVQSGTPLEELPFLTQAKRSELKALSIYTAEQLAALDGQNLKTLGMGGRELKNQAQAYLDAASGSANAVRIAAENAALRERIAALEAEVSGGDAPKPSGFDAMSDDDLKAYIKNASGSAPRGNPSHATLVRMAEELSANSEMEAA